MTSGVPEDSGASGVPGVSRATGAAGAPGEPDAFGVPGAPGKPSAFGAPAAIEADARDRRRRRWSAAALAVVVVAAGLGIHRALPSSAATDIAGDALYAALIYLLVLFAAPRVPPWAAALAAGAWCTAVELLQLTPLPATWGAAFPPARLVFGSAFDPRDLVIYAVTVVVCAVVDAAWRAWTRRRAMRAGGGPAEE